MTRKSIFVLSACLLLLSDVAFAQVANPPGGLANNVSLIRVIANPNEFDGKRIRIIGYLGLNGIDRSVGAYFSESDGRNSVFSNSVDLHIDESQVHKLIGHYVILSGTYHAPSPHAGYNGFIDHLADLKEWHFV
jgi:hypothetical protein